LLLSFFCGQTNTATSGLEEVKDTIDARRRRRQQMNNETINKSTSTGGNNRGHNVSSSSSSSSSSSAAAATAVATDASLTMIDRLAELENENLRWQTLATQLRQMLDKKNNKKKAPSDAEGAPGAKRRKT
jgi:Mg-chelatase subunit ChlI